MSEYKSIHYPNEFPDPNCIHFEIPAEDPERGVLSADVWPDAEKWGEARYWLFKTGSESETGIDGAIMERSEANCVWNTILVPSVTEYADKVSKGGCVLTERMHPPRLSDTGQSVWSLKETRLGSWIRSNREVVPEKRSIRSSDPQ
jgi:predicted enzyme related to lactoylglutathione lyase